MDINHVCTHCMRGKTVFHISLDLYDENGLLRRGVTRMKKFEFICDYCFKKSFSDFYRFSHPDVILLLKRIDQKQNELVQALDNIIDILMNYVNGEQ